MTWPDVGRVALLVLSLSAFVYGIVMTIDAFRRPSGQYPKGNKKLWCWALVIMNPVIFGGVMGTPWLFAVEPFLVVAIAYHATNRWRRPIQREPAREA